MRPSRWSDVAWRVVLAAGAAGLILAFDYDRVLYKVLPAVPWTSCLAAFVAALAELVLASGTRARLTGQQGAKPVHPIAVARTAALAKASGVVAAALTGVWAAVLLAVAFDLERKAAQHGALTAAVGVIGGALWLGAAMRLEHVCKVPPTERGATRESA